MIDRDHDLPVSKQAEVLRISRGSIYYLPRPVSAADLALMRRLDELHLEFPFAGSRMLRGLVAADGCKVGRRHVKTLMRRMGIEALYRRPPHHQAGLIGAGCAVCCSPKRTAPEGAEVVAVRRGEKGVLSSRTDSGMLAS